MSLRYCLKCQRIVDDPQALLRGDRFCCPSCRNPLRYFGREAARISAPEKLAAYDAKNPYDPVSAFEGKTVTLPPEHTDMDILECEESLTYNPNNEQALLHLGIALKTRRQFSRARQYLQKLIKLQPYHRDALRHLADVEVAEERFDAALDHMRTLEELEGESASLYFNQGVAHHFAGRIGDARTCFEKALELAHAPAFADKMRRILKQLRE